jgi:hypothetical protein
VRSRRRLHALKFGLVSEGQQESDRLWSFPEGMLGHDDSIKDFQVEATDGDAGTVSWASYAPGESYLVISLRHHSTRLTMSFPPPSSRGSAFRSGRCGSA